MHLRFSIFILFGILLVLNFVTAKHVKSPYRYRNEAKIVGGFNADLSSTRFIASLRLTIEEDFFEFGAGHKCGASLLTENILVSAAHCFYVYPFSPFDKELRDPCDWTVVLGVYNRSTQETTTVIREIKGLTVHAGYDDTSMENDIAIVFLNESVPLTAGVIEKIALNDADLESNTECQAHGWGRLAVGGALSEELQTVNISTIDIAVCNDTTSYGGEIYDGMLCVGDMGGLKDSCQGDSGGPLVCNGKLAGVVSWGNKCALPGYPGIYTDIYYYRDWLSDAVDAEPTELSQCGIQPSTESPIYSSTDPSSSSSSSPSSSSSMAPTSSPVGSTTPSSAVSISISAVVGLLLVCIVMLSQV